MPQDVLKRYGLRGLERVRKIHHTTVMHWKRKAATPLTQWSIWFKELAIALLTPVPLFNERDVRSRAVWFKLQWKHFISPFLQNTITLSATPDGKKFRWLDIRRRLMRVYIIPQLLQRCYRHARKIHLVVHNFNTHFVNVWVEDLR